MGLDHSAGHGGFDEGIAHIRQGGVAIQAAFGFHFQNGMFQGFDFILGKLQFLGQRGVAFDELGGAEAPGNPHQGGVVFDEMHHRMDAAVHGTFRTEILHGGDFLFPGGFHAAVHQFPQALALDGGNGHHGHAQGFGQALDVDGAAVFPDLVHHIQGDDHGHPQGHQLQRQIEIALDIGGVHDIDDAVGLLLQQEIPGDDFFTGIGAQGIDARQIHQLTILYAPDGAGFLIHGDPGEIAHVLIGAGEGVKEGGFTAILVARQRENHTGFTSIHWASSRRRVSS